MANSSWTSNPRQFEGTDHADIYLKYRPVWPPEVIQKSLSFLHDKMPKPSDLAVDVGCGSGQNMLPLSPHFKKVIGVDVSEAQIAAGKRADNPPNVEFMIGSGENIPVADGSVDLITCAQSVHWFDLKTFFKEVDRVLKPSGCVALYTYHILWPWIDGDVEKNKQLEKIIIEHDFITLAPYSSFHHDHLRNMMANIHIPYKETIRDNSMFIRLDSTMLSYMGYLRSRCGYQGFRDENPNEPDPLVEVQERLTAILGVEAPADYAEVHARAPVALLLGRKPSHSAENK